MNPFFKYKNLDCIIALAGYFLIALFIFNKILLSPGTVGFFHDWFMGPYPEMNSLYANGGFYIWNSFYGNKVYPTDWIFRLILIPFSFLGGETLTKGLLMLIVTLSGFGAYSLGRRLGLSQYSSFAAGILYIFSPILFTRIVAGHMYYLLAYFLSPLILSSFLTGKDDKKIDSKLGEKQVGPPDKNKHDNNNNNNNNKIKKYTNYKYFIIAGLLTAVAIIQIQFLIMIFVILLVFTLVDIKNIKRSALGLVIVFSITFLVNLSPVVLSQTMVKTPTSYFNPVQLLSNSEVEHASNLDKSLRLLGYEIHSYSYTNLGTPYDRLFNYNKGIIPQWIFYLDFLIPIVGFSALIVFRKDKLVLSFAIISLIGLFLLKGLNPPLPSIFSFLFIHGFFIFRELWHMSFLYGFGISFLIAFFLERLLTTTIKTTTSKMTRRTTPAIISKSSSKAQNDSSAPSHHNPSNLSLGSFFLSISSYLSSRISHSFHLYNGSKSYYKIILASLFVCLIVVSNGYPLLIGNFGGYLQTYTFPKEYQVMYNRLLTNNTYNTLILPLFNPIQYNSLKLSGVDPLILDSANNIFDQSGYYLTSHPLSGISTWLHSVMQLNRTNDFGNLLSGFGIKYVILRKDFVSNYPQIVSLGRYTPFLTRWYSSLEPFLNSQKDLVVIANTSHYKIYENTNDAKKIFIPLTVQNGLSDFRDLIYISNFTSLANVGVYPVDKNTPYYDFIPLGQFAPTFSAREGWTTNRDWFGYNYLLASRVNVGALTISNISKSPLEFELTLPPKYQNKPIELWMKAFTWDRGSWVSISINGKESSYNLYSARNGFSLIKIYNGTNYAAPPANKLHVVIKNIAAQNYIEGFYVKQKGIETESQDNNAIRMISMAGILDQSNLLSNPNFSLGKSNQSSSSSSAPLYWEDQLKNCQHLFKCTVNYTSGWEDSNANNMTSFQISTTSTKIDAWSEIFGSEIEVFPSDRYQLITHMKLNQYARQSHVAYEGYNETSSTWQQLIQCPSGTSGPLEWHKFVCVFTIPNDISKIRPVLKAGWSSQPGKQAITMFSGINILNSNVEGRTQNIGQIENQVAFLSDLSQPEISKTSKVNPTLWDVRVNNVTRAFTLSFAEPYDPTWEARIYKDGKKVDVVSSTPLYGSINAFQINHTGNNLDIQIRYTRQDWFETGMYISAISLAFCLLYLFYDLRRRRSKGEGWTTKIGRKIIGNQ